jgi:hypothetical protein
LAMWLRCAVTASHGLIASKNHYVMSRLVSHDPVSRSRFPWQIRTNAGCTSLLLQTNR